MERGSQPHSLWHIARAQAAAETLDKDAASRLATLLERTGGGPLMAIRTTRPIIRNDNVLVLGPLD